MPLTVALCLVLGVACAVLATLWLRTRRELAASELTRERLAELVEARVERPNLFGHEVRTPLALVHGAAELLAEQSPGPLNERQREFVDTIATNSRQVIAMAEDLLVEAQLQEDIFEPRLQCLELRQLVRATVREVRRVTSTTLVLVDSGAPILVNADPDLLRQALWNLVNNAVRHAGEQETVTVEVQTSGAEAVLQVTDQGRGMDWEERERLFEPYAVGASRRPGTGLGMMVTRRIIERHGGRILVDTQPGRGTSVLLVLPVIDEDEEDGNER